MTVIYRCRIWGHDGDGYLIEANTPIEAAEKFAKKMNLPRGTIIGVADAPDDFRFPDTRFKVLTDRIVPW